MRPSSPEPTYRNPHDPNDPEPWGPAETLPPSAPLGPVASTGGPGAVDGRPARRDGRRSGRRVGAVLTTGLVVAGAAWAGAGLLGSDVTTEVTAPVTSVRVISGNTAIQVRYEDVPTARIIEHDRQRGSRLEQRVVDGELIVDYRGGGFSFGPSFNRRLDIVLPAGTRQDTPDLVVRGTTGSITVDGDFGTTDLTTTTGSVRASGGFDTVRTKVTTGGTDVTGRADSASAESTTGSIDIRVEGSRSVRAQASTGSVDVTVDGPQPDEVEARTTTGSVDVDVPDGSYAVQATSRTGSVRVDVDEDGAAPHRIQAETGTGSVRIF